MPELPEVEAIRMQLEKFLVGHVFETIEVKVPRIFEGEKGNIEGAKFTAARRFGKVLSLDFDNKFSLMIHVKMTGQLIYRGPNLPEPPLLSKKVSGGIPNNHTHVIFHLDSGGILYFNDFRRFGWIKVVQTSEVENTGLVAKMGPEPFAGLTLEIFQNILAKTRRPVKVVIMDQEKISGVGNIYANDALFESKIHPARPAKSLTSAEVKSLYDAIHSVLKAGMKYGGSSENTFVTPDGAEGAYQRHTLVYAKAGQTCSNCKTEKIARIQLGGRGTFFCPRCQN